MALEKKLNDLTQAAQDKQSEMEAEIVNKVKLNMFNFKHTISNL